MTSEHSYPGWRFLVSPRWFGYYAMLLVFAIACVLLSQWQFDRRDQARAEISRIDTNYDAAPVPLTELASEVTTYDDDAMKWRPVTARGSYVGTPTVVRNRPNANGDVGSDLIQAFQTEAGPVVMVNRGWVPIHADVLESQPELLMQAPTAETDEPLELLMRIRQAEPRIPGRETTSMTAGSVHIPDLVSLTVSDHPAADTPAYTGFYGMLVEESPAQPVGELPPKPQRDEGAHFSYALQWLVFILIAGGGISYAARQEFRNFNRGSARVRAQDERRAVRKARRGLTDAEEEDAWLEDAAGAR